MMKQFRLPFCAMLALIVLCCQADIPVVAQEAVPSRTGMLPKN